MTSLFEFYTKLANYESELKLNSFYAYEFRTIDALKQEFEGVIEPLSKIQKGKFVDPVDEDAKFNFIKKLSKKEIDSIARIIDEKIGENNTNEGQILLLKRVYSEIEWQIVQLEKNPILKDKFSFFKNDLIQLKSQLFFKYHYLIPIDKESEKSIITSTSKIKWNAGVATLATMFSELTNLKISEGDPYISNTPKEIIDFIVANFVGKDNEVFDEATLGRYLLLKPSKKSAKVNKVDLDKLLPETD